MVPDEEFGSTMLLDRGQMDTGRALHVEMFPKNKGDSGGSVGVLGADTDNGVDNQRVSSSRPVCRPPPRFSSHWPHHDAMARRFTATLRMIKTNSV